MTNKILIVDPNAQDRADLEQILQEIVQEGGELFFAEKKEDGIAILKKEKPHILILDDELWDPDEKIWEQEGVKCLLMKRRQEQRSDESVIFKPFKAHQVLHKCRAWLGKEEALEAPPM